MVCYICNKIKSDFYEYLDIEMYCYIYLFFWFLRNKDNLMFFQFVVKYVVIEFFEEIFNIKDVYCYISVNDGLFDVKEYDIMEIDIVSIICLW